MWAPSQRQRVIFTFCAISCRYFESISAILLVTCKRTPHGSSSDASRLTTTKISGIAPIWSWLHCRTLICYFITSGVVHLKFQIRTSWHQRKSILGISSTFNWIVCLVDKHIYTSNSPALLSRKMQPLLGGPWPPFPRLYIGASCPPIYSSRSH